MRRVLFPLALASLLAPAARASEPPSPAAPPDASSAAAPPAAASPGASSAAPSGADGQAEDEAEGEEEAVEVPAPVGTESGPAVGGAGVARAAQASDHPDGFILPVLFWLPETRLGFGGTAGLHFAGDGGARRSDAFAVAVLTLNRQGVVDVSTELWGRRGGLLGARLRASIFPDRFYGIGPETHVSQGEAFTRRYAELGVTAEAPLVPDRLRGGLRLDSRFEKVTDVQAGGVLASGTVAGVDELVAVGFGPSATWDTRDSALWTTRGTFAQAWALFYPQVIGYGHASFLRMNGEVRGFLPLPRGMVLGGAAFAEASSGETPFNLLPRLGSTRYLRGYREGRFRDALDWAAQTELRVPVKDPLAVTAFFAAGDVAPSVSRLRWDTIKYAGGLGLRWRLTREGAHIRADVAAGGDGIEAYVLILEAF